MPREWYDHYTPARFSLRVVLPLKVVYNSVRQITWRNQFRLEYSWHKLYTQISVQNRIWYCQQYHEFDGGFLTKSAFLTDLTWWIHFFILYADFHNYLRSFYALLSIFAWSRYFMFNMFVWSWYPICKGIYLRPKKVYAYSFVYFIASKRCSCSHKGILSLYDYDYDCIYTDYMYFQFDQWNILFSFSMCFNQHEQEKRFSPIRIQSSKKIHFWIA